MKVFYAPEPDRSDDENIKVFLAGSIEMGKAMPWQDDLIDRLSAVDVTLFNPRRPDWDSSWKTDPIPGTEFYQQVDWELTHIEKSNIVVFVFDENTTSPITLLELGLCLGLGKSVIVFCPEDYFRYGNVKITVDKFGESTVMANSIADVVSLVKRCVQLYGRKSDAQ